MTTVAIPIGDLAARRIVAIGRLAATLLVVALASVEYLVLPTWAVWLAGLVFAPWAAWLWIAEEGPASGSRLRAAMLGDLVALGTLMVASPDRADIVMLFAVPLAAALTYQQGGRHGAFFGSSVLALRIGTWVATGVAPPDLWTDMAIIVTGTLVILLLSRALDVQRRDARSVLRVEKKSDAIIERSPDAIIVTDAHGLILQGNPSATRTLDDTDQRPLAGHHCADRLQLHLDGGAPLDCRRSCALADLCGDDNQGVEVWRTVGEERQPLLASAAAIANASGRTEYVHSFRDITRIKQAEEAKNMFLATTSHELKTPLTVIRGFAQVLQARVEDPQAQVALDAIFTRSDELAAIVDRLLLSSRIDAGRLEITTAVVDVTALLRKRLAEVGNSMGRTIELEVSDGLTAHTAPDGLLTVIDHLLDNACKYSPGGEPVLIRADRTGSSVSIAISDQGIGMTPQQADQCFEKFWQAEATDVRRFGGTGIGLYIVRSIVTGMGGAITVDSTLGSGSTFVVTLPVHAPQPTAAPATQDAQADGDDRRNTGVDQFIQHLGIPTGAP